jgi:uncharacterized protein
VPLIQRLAALFLALLVAATAGALVASAAPNFPALTGRVVDQANVLSPDVRASLEAKLKALDDKSGIQLVVATVSSLDGLEIEPYATQLFRAWGLGEAKKNNGVLFLVAPTEHRARIEVGYGLEGTLTDATSKLIIVNAAAPRFKAGDFNGGVSRAVDDIITVLTTDASEWQKRPQVRPADPEPVLLSGLVPLAFIAFFIFILFLSARRQQGGSGGALAYLILSALMSGRGSGGGYSGGGWSGGGGFSGGGGSSGGGGASGSW